MTATETMPQTTAPVRPTVCCVMPCRTTPNAKAFKALQVAAARYGAPFDTPAREPRERNRNIAVSQFLHTDGYDWLLMVDDDTTVPHDVIDQLLAVGQPIVTGMQPLYLPIDDNGNHHLVANVMRFPTVDTCRPSWPDWLTWTPPTKPFKVFHCGFGCILMHRKVLEDTGFPWFREDYGDALGRNNITEDIWFCDHVRRAGYDIWCQPSAVCGHLKTIDLLEIVPRCRIDWQGGCTPRSPKPHAYKAIEGYFPLEAEQLFAALVPTLRSRAVWVELGVMRGRSLCYVAELCSMHNKLDTKVIGVDTFMGSPELPEMYRTNMEQVCRDSLERADVLDNVTLVKSDSADAAANFQDCTVDVVYVDAAHDYESVKRDITAWWPKLRPDGVICGDDHGPVFPGVVKAVEDTLGTEHVYRRNATWARAKNGRDPWTGKTVG